MRQLQTSPSGYAREAAGGSFGAMIVFSVLLHLVVCIVMPLAVRIIWRPRRFVRPQTFRLMPVARPRTVRRRPVARPAPEPEARPRPAPAREPRPEEPVREKVEENLDELSDFLDAIAAPVSQPSPVQDFEYPWYLNNVQMKVERFWTPPAEYANTRDVRVVVSFVIFRNGSISPVTLARSSGIAALDNLARRAIELAAPFGKLPPAFRARRLEIDYTFFPVRR